MQQKRAKRNSRILISDPTQSFTNQNTSFSINHHVITPVKKRIIKLLSCIPVLQPTSNVVLILDILTAITITYYFFQITLTLVFGHQFWIDQFTHPLTIIINIFNIAILWAGVLLQFKKGYYEQGILVLNPQEIIKNIGILNFLNLVFSSTIVSIGFYTSHYYVAYLKLGFIFRLFTLKKIDKNIQKHLLRSKKLCTIYLIARLFLILIFISHLMGLLFYLLDRHLLLTNYFGDETSSKCWLATSQAYNNLIDSEWSVQYLYTFYWAVNYLTSIAFGDVAPLNAIQAGFTGIISMASIFHFNYFIFMIVKILMQHRLKSQQHQKNTKQLSQFLHKNLDKTNYESIMNHYQRTKEKTSSQHQIKDIIKGLPHQLQYNILGNIHQQFLQESNLLNLFPLSLIQKLLFIVNVKEIQEGDSVYQSLNHDLNLYYLKQGAINFVYGSKYNVKSIQTGSFDLYEFISGKQKRFDAIAQVSSTLYQINRQQFVKVVYQKQQHIELLRYKIDLIDSGRQGKVIDLKCILCNQSHLIQNCPQTLFGVKQLNQTRSYPQRRNKSRRRNYQSMKYYKGNRKIDNIYSLPQDIQNLNDNYAENIIRDISPNSIEQIIKDLERQVQLHQVDVDIGKNYQYYFPGFNVSSIQYFWSDNFVIKSSSSSQ